MDILTSSILESCFLLVCLFFFHDTSNCVMTQSGCVKLRFDKSLNEQCTVLPEVCTSIVKSDGELILWADIESVHGCSCPSPKLNQVPLS